MTYLTKHLMHSLSIQMKASIVDLRYKMNDVLKALDRNEEVSILYRGKEKGKIVPPKKRTTTLKVEDHPFFGSKSHSSHSVDNVIEELRSGRYQ